MKKGGDEYWSTKTMRFRKPRAMGLKVTLWSIRMSQAQSIVLGLNMLVLIKYTLKLDERIEGFKIVSFLLYSKLD